MENGAVESDALGVLCAAISAPGHKTLQSQPRYQQCSGRFNTKTGHCSAKRSIRRSEEVLPGSAWLRGQHWLRKRLCAGNRRQQ
eukprot:COSAG03_NODE_1129_length_4764_cov_227.213719_3_plen_84_part_00